MSEYTPEKWSVIKISHPERNPIYKVFGTWYYGNVYGDSWRLNSGITKVALKDSVYHFEGSSGSVYRCNEIYYGTTGYGAFILSGMIERVEEAGGKLEILPEETNWLEINYE